MAVSELSPQQQDWLAEVLSKLWASSWYTALDGSVHDGTFHSHSFGTCVHERFPLCRSGDGFSGGTHGFFSYGFFYVRVYWNACGFQVNLVDFLLLFAFEEDLGRRVSFFDCIMVEKDSYVARWPRSLLTSAAACTWLVFQVTIFHAVFPSVVVRPKMLGILVAMDQKDSYAAEGLFGGEIVVYVPVVCSNRCAVGFGVQKTGDFPKLQLIKCPCGHGSPDQCGQLDP